MRPFDASLYVSLYVSWRLRKPVLSLRRSKPMSTALSSRLILSGLALLALGVAGPALGLIAGGAVLSAVFLAGALVALGAAAVAARLLYAPSLAR